jgi:hypothetical protein
MHQQTSKKFYECGGVVLHIKLSMPTDAFGFFARINCAVRSALSPPQGRSDRICTAYDSLGYIPLYNIPDATVRVMKGVMGTLSDDSNCCVCLEKPVSIGEWWATIGLAFSAGDPLPSLWPPGHLL